MATRNTHAAFYAWAVVYDWVIAKMAEWDIKSLSKFINQVLMLWILMDRHRLLDPALAKIATLEGFVSVDQLRDSLSEYGNSDDDDDSTDS